VKICQVATGYTSIPAKASAATEIVIEHLSNSLIDLAQEVTVVDISDRERTKSRFKVIEVAMPEGFGCSDYTHDLGIKHKLKRLIYSINASRALNSKMTSKDMDILHVHNQYNGFFIRLKYPGAKIPMIYTLHSHIWTRPWDEIKDKIKINYWM